MVDEKLTTEELYGKSEPPRAAGIASGDARPAKPLVYEETPIIEPVIPSAPPPKPTRPKNASNFITTIGTILLFIMLFGIGVWLSTVVRQYLPGTSNQTEPTRTPYTIETPATYVTPTVTNDQFPGWRSYTINDASYRLPSEVLAPICDGANCASQGTYLPGGTRFTIAPRGGGQALRDFRGAVVTDAGGRKFTTTPTTIAGKQALEFRGLFTGTTSGGYSFSQMRGVMIEVDSTLSLEINHFTPTGVSADFVSDEALFNQILQTLVLPS